MKKAWIPVMLAALLAGMAGCGKGEETTAVTESSDPARIVGEKVDRTAWTSAFKPEKNFSLKSVVNVEMTQDGTPMSETVTYVYRIAADKMSLRMTMAEGGKTLYEAEGYLETEGDAVSFWQRAKESGEKDWEEWDGETYQKSDLPEIFAVMDGLSFVSDNYADFSYSDADKGYLATTSGLAEMQAELAEALESLLSGTFDGLEGFDLSKLVVKINGGKPSACLVTLSMDEAEKSPSPEDQAQPKTKEGDTMSETEGGGSSSEGDMGSPETPDGGAEGPETPDGGTDGSETPAPAKGSVSLTQLFFDYGTTAVSRPEQLPSLGEESPAQRRMYF